ncbi:MAG: tetratricopeptide repeat protein [Segetibacter sp.]
MKEAADKEDGMLYNEPKDWLLPARHFLGHALLKAKKYTEAVKVYKEDLKINPNNGWALTGLAEALIKQGKKKMAMEVQRQAKAALERSDVQISSSV